MHKKGFLRIIISLVLLGITIFNVGNTFWQQKDKYLSQDYWKRFPALKQTYLDSQYVSKHPKGWIPDEPVNAYAGGAYAQGISPILVAPDTPPLGRYLIGLSASVFNNENIATLVSVFVSLLFLYILGRQIYANNLASLLLVALVTAEPIFTNQILYTPLLDIIQLMFLLISFYFFNKGLTSKKHLLFFVFSSMFLGFFISTKFFATGTTILAAYYTILILHKKKKQLLSLTISMPLSVGILLLSYIRVIFELNYGFMHFLGIQKYVFLYHKSQLILPFSIWPLMLFNKWYVWWGDKPILSDPQWQITWPLITIGSLITILLVIFKKIPSKIEVEVLMAWIVWYFLFFSFGQVSARYFVILIPVLYIVAIYGVEKITQLIINKKIINI